MSDGFIYGGGDDDDVGGFVVPRREGAGTGLAEGRARASASDAPTK